MEFYIYSNLVVYLVILPYLLENGTEAVRVAHWQNHSLLVIFHHSMGHRHVLKRLLILYYTV